MCVCVSIRVQNNGMNYFLVPSSYPVSSFLLTRGQIKQMTIADGMGL